MARKLLKRKRLASQVVKKLKTLKRTKTSLGHWASTQLSKMHTQENLIPYPRFFEQTCYNKFLHRNQLLNQVIAFPGGLTKTTPSLQNHVDKIKVVTLKLETDKNKDRDRLKHPKDKTISHWPLYNLRYKTHKHYNKNKVALKVPSTGNWKHIYSLDQLMCHQFDGKFRRRISHHKARLIEKQKLKTLYGTLSKKQSRQATRGLHTLSRSFETRLDVALKKTFVFTTLRNAQHWISLGRILVNHRVIKSSSYILQPGDLLSIDKTHSLTYKTLFLNAFYKTNKESKYLQGAWLLRRWKEWATLYNSLGLHHKHQQSKNTSWPDNLLKRIKKGTPWPDKNIQYFWYLSGRSALKCLEKKESYEQGYEQRYNNHNVSKSRDTRARFGFCRNLFRELSFQKRSTATSRWLRWKSLYRKRILLFSRWLLTSQPLVRDGLYFLRWHRAFIRKKSTWIRGCHRHLTMQKPLHLEVSYKKLCALYLYPPQRIAWPCMINYK